MEFKEELELLLNNFIITKEKNKDAYYKVKSKIKKLKEFASTKLGCDIIVNSSLIKLEKRPVIIDETFKIDFFDSKKDYILFMCLIMFLEDKSKEEQFILSNLTTFIENTLATFDASKETIDFKDYSTRKSLVNVLKYATNLNIIRLRDGNETLFKDSIDNEVLYETTGISRYLVRQFQNEIFSYKDASSFLEDEMEEDSVNKRRYDTYRSLLFYPVFHYHDLKEDVYNYFIAYRNRVINDLDGLLDGDLLIFKNMALLTTTEKTTRETFPNSRKMISDILLLVNQYLTKEEIGHEKNGFLYLEKIEFHHLLSKLHKENCLYFSKEYREMKQDKFQEEVIKAMKSFKMVEEFSDYYQFSPTVYLINGDYIKETEEKEDLKSYEQLSINMEV